MFTTTLMRISAITLATALSTTVLAGPVFANPALASDDDSGRVTRSVSTAGLNLADSTDQAILRHRVAVAAHQVCLRLEDGEPLGSPAFADCLRRVRGDAMQQAEARIAAAQGQTLIASLPHRP